MQSLRRTAVTTARKGRTTLPRPPRRFAHDEHAHAHAHDAPLGNEGFGVRPHPLPLPSIPRLCARS
ncbi:hypothetical protein K505DRAFT_32161 [Melanomma pulvis-pyrius CBS 109.77]|uniref:Uncharacterized protein n=1 Tax=Melanomma pulvis-pyrius CBS 109.77 TaxID=1314802 RepID=A0A6A6XU90_9PLEO|nr:hypothetical protein K505DRAFT_32161 [Melanomma pulvis-pyrius CBS 109.77]